MQVHVPILFSILSVTAMFSFSAVAQNNLFPNVVPADTFNTVPATATGQLKTRKHTLTVYAGPNGPLYTVLDADGNVQGFQLTEELLAKRFPVLRSILDSRVDGADLNLIENRAPAGGILF